MKITDEMVIAALEFATEKHKGVYRKGNSEPYINHPIRVAEYVREFKKDSKNLNLLLVCAYLHDTVEDTDTTIEELRSKFGNEVASIVSELTTNKKMKKLLGKPIYLKLKLEEISPYALTIKLCDRLDNISDLTIVDKDFRERYIAETVEIIEYIRENRTINKTQLKLIKEIYSRLAELEIMVQDKPDIFNIISNTKNSIIYKLAKI